jgi:hypothetical protein
MSPAIGALLVIRWEGAVVLLAGLAAGRLMHQTALVSLGAELALVPVLARGGGLPGAVAAAAIVGPMVAKRLAGNGKPAERRAETYVTRLLFDRDDPVVGAA